MNLLYNNVQLFLKIYYYFINLGFYWIFILKNKNEDIVSEILSPMWGLFLYIIGRNAKFSEEEEIKMIIEWTLNDSRFIYVEDFVYVA